MVKSFLTENPSQTKKIGEILAKEFLKTRPRSREISLRGRSKKAIILGLSGELGGGKTTFLQGFAKGLGVKEKILSPTFIIMRKFKIPKPGFEYKNFYHIDCYRLQKPKEILALGFKQIISNPQNIVAIEWADRIKKIIPRTAIQIKFKFITKNTRKIMLR